MEDAADAVGCSDHSHFLRPGPLQTPVVPRLVLPPEAGTWALRTSDLCPCLSHTSLPQQSSATLLSYLKRLQESPVAPIFKLVLFWAQSQHGLCVGMELVVKIV